MTTLNKRAAEVIQQGEFRIHAMTDVTGFGLIGHAREMALASNVSLRLHTEPHSTSCRELSNAFAPDTFPAASRTTVTSPNAWSIMTHGISEDLRALLFDPQTAGGLMISVAPEDSAQFAQSLNAAGISAAEIGEVLFRTKPLIAVGL